jgi:hypothetical protein
MKRIDWMKLSRCGVLLGAAISVLAWGLLACGEDASESNAAQTVEETSESIAALSAGDVCGGPKDIACGAKLCCELPANEPCGSFGTCKARPTICPDYCTTTCRTCSGLEVCNACLAHRGGETTSSCSCPPL